MKDDAATARTVADDTVAADAAVATATMTAWTRLQAIADEQAGALMRTAFSPIVRESGDLSAGVFDADGKMLVQAVTGTPGHVNTMASACANFFIFFPRDEMRDGDILATNDPWLGAGHLNDFVLVKPCFYRGALAGFVSCTSHLVDIGGQCMGPDGVDVFDEGLYVPPLKLVDAGVVDATLIKLLRANSRIADESEGDLHALIACCEVGARRVGEMLDEFNLADLCAVSAAILSASENATRARIEKLPDGVYANRMLTDGYDFEVKLAAELTVAGDEIKLHINAPGLSKHGINVPLNYARAYATFGVKCAVAPDIPNNAGALAPVTVTAPPDCIVNARKPAPVCSRHIIGQLLPDLALGCLHRLKMQHPDAAVTVPAEGAATLWDLPLRSVVGARRPFSVELVHNGGVGARAMLDGLSATGYPSGVMGSMVEITENVAPLRVNRRELRADSGGVGLTRGGLGQVIELESTDGAPLQLFGTVDRIKHPARGRDGGGDGARGVLRLGGGGALDGKGRQVIPAGDALLALTPGGGGYGDPLARAVGAVADDVADGLVSVEAAAREYGVVVGDDGVVDADATARLRR